MIDEAFLVANVLQDGLGASMSRHLHDLVDPSVVHCRAGYEPGTQGVPGVVAWLETNSPGMALYNPCDIAWIKCMAGRHAATQQRLEDITFANAGFLQPAFQMRNRSYGLAFNHGNPLSCAIRIRFRLPHMHQYSPSLLELKIICPQATQL